MDLSVWGVSSEEEKGKPKKSKGFSDVFGDFKTGVGSNFDSSINGIKLSLLRGNILHPDDNMTEEEWQQAKQEYENLKQEQQQTRLTGYEARKRLEDEGHNILARATTVGGSLPGVAISAVGTIGSAVAPVAAPVLIPLTIGASSLFDAAGAASEAADRVFEQGGTEEQAYEAFNKALPKEMLTTAPDAFADYLMSSRIARAIRGTSTFKNISKSQLGKLVADPASTIGTTVASTTNKRWAGKAAGMATDLFGQVLGEEIQETGQNYVSDVEANRVLGRGEQEYSLGGYVNSVMSPEGIETLKDTAVSTLLLGGLGAVASRNQYTKNGFESDVAYNVSKNADEEIKQLKAQTTPEKWNEMKQMVADMYDTNAESLSDKDVYRMFVAKWTQKAELDNMARDESNGMFATKKFTEFLTGEIPNNENHTTKTFDEIWGKNHDISMFNQDRQEYEQARQQVEQTVEQQREQAENIVNSVNNKEQNTESTTFKTPNSKLGQEVASQTQPQSYLEQRRQGATTSAVQSDLFSPKTNFVPKQTIGKWTRATDEVPGYGNAPYVLGDRKVRLTKENNGTFYVSDENNKKSQPIGPFKTQEDAENFIQRLGNGEASFGQSMYAKANKQENSQKLPQGDGDISQKDGPRLHSFEDLHKHYVETKGKEYGLSDYEYMTITDLMNRVESQGVDVDVVLNLHKKGYATDANGNYILNENGERQQVFGQFDPVRDKENRVIKAIITLYEGADTYTALHEIAHIGYENMSEKDKEIHRIYAEKTAPRFLAKMLGYEYSPEFEQNLKQALLTKDTPLWAEIDRLGVTAECIDLVNTDEIKKVFNILQTQPLTPQQRQQYLNYYNQLAELHQRAIEERYAWEFTFWVKDGYTKSVAPKNIYQRILNKTCDSLGIELYKVIDTAKRLKSDGWEDFQFKDGEKTVAKMYEEMSLRRREEQAQVQEQQAQQQAEQQAEQQMQQQMQEQMQQQMPQEPVQQQIVSQETMPQQMPQETVPQQTAPIYTTEGGSQQNVNNIENPVTTPVVNNVQTPDNPQEQQTQQKTEVKKNNVKPRQEVEENKYKNWDDASLIRFLNNANPNEVSYAEINAAYQEARRRGYAKPKDLKNTPLPEIFKNINGEGHWAGRRTKYGEQDLFDIVYQEKNIPSELRNNFPDNIALKLLDKVVKQKDEIAQVLFNQLPDEQRSRVQQQYIEEVNRGVQEETEQTQQLGSTQKETKQQEEVKETKQEAKQETKEEEKVQQEETEQKEKAKMLKTDKKDVSFTDNNKRIETTFALMELDDVVPSHIKDNRQLVENPNYPTEYQPRNRKDLKSLQQITEMANKLEPELLGSSPNINGGAPIVLNDGVVINGNARAITLKEVFGRKLSDENQKKYIDFLKKNAERFGFKKQDVDNFNKPVLVRVLDNKQDIKEISNSFAGGQNLGAVEKAKIDGNTLSESTLKEFKTESDTAFDKDYNHNFFINAIDDIVKKFPSRRGDLMTADGGISNDGVETIKRALFARAYNDLELLTSMAEDIGEVRKNIINALTAAAPSVIRADIRMKNGMLHSYDLVKNLIDGVNIINTAVRNDLTAEQYLQQNETAMFGNEEYSPEAIENAKNLDYSRMRRSAKKQTEYIKEIIKGIEEQGKAIEQNLEGKKEEIAPLLDLEKQAFEKIFPQENSLFSENTTETKYQRASQRQEQLQEVANMLKTPMVELNIATAKDKKAQDLLKETMMRPENGFTEKEADDLIKELIRIADAVEEISKQYGELYDFQHWKVEDIRKFYEKLNKILPVRGAFLNNGEYIYNIDLGAMCTKKEAPDLIHQIFVDMGYGQQLGPTQMEAIKDILREQGFLVPCDCCFVEAHRLRMLMTANKLMYEWKSTLMAAGIMDDNKLGDSRTFTPEQYKRLVEMAGQKEGFSYKQAYEKYMPKSRRRIEKVMGIVEKTGKVRKVTIDNGITADRMKEIAQLFLQDSTLAGEFNPDTLLTTKGTDDLLYRYGPNTGIRGFLGKLDGSSSAKLLEHYKPYDELSYFFMDEDKILRDRGADKEGNVDVNRKNKNIYDDGGFRVQSFTDFTPLLFFDYCQMVVGLQARRLPMHAYTKVPSFVKLFGKTGIMINMSMVPEIIIDKSIDKDHIGLRYNKETGEYEYAWHPDSFPWELALQYQKEYRTAGITAVGVSKYHILKLLADPNIGQVIPYHKSGMPPQIQIKTGFKYATNYTDYQTTKLGNNEDEISRKKQEIKDETGYSADVYLNYSRILFEMKNKYPKDKNNPKRAAQEYLKRCRDFKCTPVFEEFSKEEGYYKLLQDFKSYDAEGNPVYQEPVRFKLPDNWVEIFKKALEYREETRKQLDSLKNNEKVLKKVEKVLEKQRLDGAVREIMIRRLKDALGNNNVQSLRNDVFFDTLEAEYAKQMGVEQAKQRIEEFRNKDGWVYGFSSGDKIYLNESLFNANTPAHEFTHIWAKVAQIKNPQLWKEGVELLKTEAKDVWDEVVNDELYANIRGNENAIASEVLARIVGKENEYMVEKLLDPKRKPLTKKSFTEKIRLWVVRLFNEVRSLFDGYNGKPLTYEEFTKMPLRALWETKENKQFRELLKKARKAKLIENNVSAETNVELMAGGIDRKGGLNEALLETVFKKEFFNAAQPYVSSGLLTRRDVEKLYAVEMKDHSNDYFDHARGVNKNFHKYFTKIHKKVNDKLWRRGMEVQKGFDGKWRFYFSDKKMKIKDDFKKYLTKGYKGPIPKNLKLSDVMEHDLLFKYYPELKDVAVEIVNKGNDSYGVYNDKENKIEINKDLTFFEPLKLDKKSTLSPEEQLKRIKERNRRMENELRGTLVHEPQHAIQTIEGFSTGASVESASNDYEKPFYNLIDEIQRRKEDFMKYLREETSIRSEATFKRMSDLIDDKQKLIDQVRGILRAEGSRPKTAMQKYLFDYLYKENEETGERSILYRVYEETLGEQEAFDAERRLNMTEEQEKNTPPLSNYNLKEMKYNEGEFLERKPSPLDEFINGKRPLNTHNDKEILYEDKNGELKVRKEDQDKAQMANDLLNQLNSVLPNKSPQGRRYMKATQEPLFKSDNNADIAYELKDFYSVSFKRSAQNNEENKRKMKYFEDNKNFWKKETDKDGTVTYSRSKPLDHHKNTVSYSGINGVETGKTTKATLMEWKDWLKGQVIKALFNDRYFLAKLARDLGVYDKYEEMIVQSKGGAIAGYVLEHGYTRKDGTKTKAMNKIIIDIGDKQHEFNEYCLAKYVVELQGQGRIMNGEKAVSLKMSVQEAEKIIKDVENSSDYNLFEENRKALVENYHEMLRNTLVDSGIKSEKWFNNWVKNNQNAIPVVEVSDEEDFGYMSAQRARKLANLQNPFEQIGNSTREIANPLVEMQKTVALYHAIAARNKAAVTFVNGIAKRLETLANGDTVVRGQGVIRRVEVDETNGKEITKPKNDKQIISVYNNGELEFYQVSDKEIFDAINTMTYEQLSTVRKICDKIGSTPASLVRITATMVPDFGIRNFIRDNTEAFFTSENGFLPFLDGIWGVWQFYTNGEWARKYLELNGEFNTLNREEENLARATKGTHSSFKDIWNETKRNASQSKQQMLDSTRANFVRVTDIKDGKFEKAWNDARKSRLAGLVGLCKSPVTGLYEMNKRFNDMLELGTRIAEFKNAAMGYHGTMDRIKNGKLWASNEDIKNAKRDFNYASSKAAQITLDFSQHGTVGGFLNHYIPFFNASLQGIYKTCNALDLMIFGNTMDGKPDSVLRQELIFKTILMGCIGIAVAAAGRGDDDYDEAPEYEKSNYWILPNGIRIPKDQVMGKLIGGTVEKMYNQIADGNFKPTDIVKDIISNFAPDNIMPELLNLGIGYIGNYDTFKQREITPYYMADKLGHLQKDLGTSNFAANLSKALYDVAGIDISAKKLDWAIQRHLSNMGKYALAVYDAGYKGFNPKEFNERMTRGYDKNDATGSLVGALSEIPVLKTFTTNRTSYTSIDNFYKKYNELKKTSSDEKSMTREEKREWKRYQDANKKMKKYRDQLRAIRQNASLSGTEKRQKADVIFERQLKLVKWAEQK